MGKNVTIPYHYFQNLYQVKTILFQANNQTQLNKPHIAILLKIFSGMVNKNILHNIFINCPFTRPMHKNDQKWLFSNFIYPF